MSAGFAPSIITSQQHPSPVHTPYSDLAIDLRDEYS